MTQEYPFTPTAELMQEWLTRWKDKRSVIPYDEFFAFQAAQWGADQELKACVEWMGNSPVIWRGDPEEHPGFYLREARRPKPTSLKEQALTALDDAILRGDCITTSDALPVIRQALEQLDD